ncbi:MAG TPA: TonB-dependent receptor plug domain-containing protein, partial [Oceanipulchritudo sp.]|nr:TonB-dependent receptor plug domain-containing protein [Oceanipulchritudo sp.]
MKNNTQTKRVSLMAILGLIGALLPQASVFGQADAGETTATSSEVFELSPFEVSTSDDRGYYASNAISGSRIAVPIQDMPLTIEVVTSEFIEDTGATDLRDTLKYSAGILLQSQNDAFGSFDNLGNVNNPEGATGDKGDSSFKIRGFVVENTLRNGFRRQNATDTINIDRVEVIRGPSALLYGVGNFGGVVNYITKTPLPEFQEQFLVSVGSDGYQRASMDTTGPLFSDKLGYRLTAAYQDSDSWTDLNTREHFFISPVIQWKPWKRVKLTLDLEYGKADEDAVSFMSVRAPTLEGVPITQTDRLETYGFLEFPGKDVRTFRWSGPDSYLDTLAKNG